MTDTICTGVWCPRCGRKEAIIKRVPLIEEPSPSKKKAKSLNENWEKNSRLSQSVIVVHPLCGYQKTLHSYLEYEVFHSTKRLDIDIPELINRKLIVTTSDSDDISSSITKALIITDGFFFNSRYIRNYDKIKDLTCPFCQRTAYTVLLDAITCQCTHYQIPAINMIYTSVQFPFYLLPEDYPSSYPLKVVINHPRKNRNYVCKIAEVKYFFNPLSDNQRILLVTKLDEGYKTDYAKFLKSLKKNSEPIFTVIEKVVA